MTVCAYEKIEITDCKNSIPDFSKCMLMVIENK